MSRTLSSSFARCYGLARVARVWKISRASVYRSRKETPPDMIARRPGPIGACSDAELADHIRRHIAASRLHGVRSRASPVAHGGGSRERQQAATAPITCGSPLLAPHGILIRTQRSA